MVADRRAAPEPVPIWKKPNWLVPILVAMLNALAIVGVAHVTARDVAPLRPADGTAVLDGRLVRSDDSWDLRALGSAEEVQLSCVTHTNVTVAVRTAVTTFTAVLCPSPTP